MNTFGDFNGDGMFTVADVAGELSSSAEVDPVQLAPVPEPPAGCYDGRNCAYRSRVGRTAAVEIKVTHPPISKVFVKKVVDFREFHPYDRGLVNGKGEGKNTRDHG